MVLHRNSSVPNFRREGKRMEGLRKPGITALNRATALQDELSRLRSQIAKIVAGENGTHTHRLKNQEVRKGIPNQDL